MLSTRTIISSPREIPETWIFEHYLNLAEKLDGREVRMKSIFNPTEKTPSMYIYPRKDGRYRFKDFSSGHQGNGFDLIKLVFGMNDIKQVTCKLMKDYNEAVLKGNYSIEEFKVHSKFQVSDYEARNWTNLDAKYWTQFGIGSRMLTKYNVMPLSFYKMRKDDNEIVINGHHIYGYFRSDGLIYKIYQPKVQSKKFLKVRSHLQGYDQLTFGKPNLVILSSLKDLMTFESLGFKTIECVAPDSENTQIPESHMKELMERYHTVTTLFDNDDAGLKAVERYKTRYGINGFVLGLEKDVSDSVVKHGKDFVKSELVPLLTECIHTCRRCPESSTSV
jgi:hypothetical protein